MKVILNAQNLRNVLRSEIVRSFGKYKSELSRLFAHIGHAVPDSFVNLEDISKDASIVFIIRSDPTVHTEDVFMPLKNINNTVEKVEAANKDKSDRQSLLTLGNRKVNLRYHCQEHQEDMGDAHLYVHLRKKHGIGSGGKLLLKYAPVDLSSLSISMTPVHVRELVFRELKFILEIFLRKMERLNVFNVAEVTLPILSKRVAQNAVEMEHILMLVVADNIVNTYPASIEYSLLEMFKSAELAVNMARYHPDDPDVVTELRVNSITYSFSRLLGEGSFGRCFEIQSDISNDGKACKAIQRCNADIIDLIENEVKIHSSFQHENIVELFASFHDEQYQFLVLELCDETLHDLIEKKRFVDFDQCRDLMRQVLAGCAYMQMKNIIHRDLKPSNVLLQRGNVKICDFGLAIAVDAPDRDLRMLCGTIPYLPPEVINKDGARLESDIWAIAVMTYYMLKGERPFSRLRMNFDDPVVKCEVFNRIRRGHYAIKEYDEPHFIEFIQSAFKTDPNVRPLAEWCLRLPMFSDTKTRVTVPRKDDEVFVIPTHVIGANKIFVQLEEQMPRFNDFQFGALQSIALRTLVRDANTNDFVLARYSDGLIYRARFISAQRAKFKVLYIDYGNIGNVDELYDWDPLCDTIPIQAIRLKISGVNELKAFGRFYAESASVVDQRIENYLWDHLYFKFKAKIKDSNGSGMTAVLTNTYGKPLVAVMKFNLYG